jgi:hypothetical protein
MRCERRNLLRTNVNDMVLGCATNRPQSGASSQPLPRTADEHGPSYAVSAGLNVAV